MSDPLSLLREHSINKRPISHDATHITIGDLKFPRNTLTAYKQDRGEPAIPRHTLRFDTMPSPPCDIARIRQCADRLHCPNPMARTSPAGRSWRPVSARGALLSAPEAAPSWRSKDAPVCRGLQVQQLPARAAGRPEGCACVPARQARDLTVPRVSGRAHVARRADERALRRDGQNSREGEG